MAKKTGFVPLQVHKNFLIAGLEREDGMEALKVLFPDGRYKTPAEAIKALEEFPGEWVIDGALRSHDEHKAYMTENYGKEFAD